jgi:integrase
LAFELHKVGVRASLPARREPYWGPPLERSRYIGFRKLADGTGTWIARMLDEHGDHKYRRLGWATDKFGYTEAKKAAEAWFKGKDAGLSDEVPKLQTICEEYVEDRRTEKGEATAYDAEIRFKRTVYGKPIGAKRLDKLTTKMLKDWRAAIPGTNSAKDREWRTLKAALNLAVVNRRVSADRAIEWKSVKPLEDTDGRRELFLDLKQRRALIAAAKGVTRDTIEAAALTGARPGELVALKRSDVDLKLGTVTFTGKTGSRTVPLAPAALKVFKRLCKNKLPAAPLLPWTHSVEWSREIRNAAQRAKLPNGVVLYTLRHSFITEALRGGMATLDVARLTGTSLAMIQDHYGHLVADSARERLAAVTML